MSRARHREQGLEPSHWRRRRVDSAMRQQWWHNGSTDLGLAHFAALTRILRTCQPARALARLDVSGGPTVFGHNDEHVWSIPPDL